MVTGMTALSLQLLVQIVDALIGWKGKPHVTGPEWKE
jgi:hypothetical protein